MRAIKIRSTYIVFHWQPSSKWFPIRMEDCGTSERDFYWFDSNAQTTVDAMMEAEVRIEVDAVTSGIISAVVNEEEEAGSRISDFQAADLDYTEDEEVLSIAAAISQDIPSADTQKQTTTTTTTTSDALGGSPLSESRGSPIDRADNNNDDKEDEEALLGVARVLEETCNKIARQNELASSDAAAAALNESAKSSSASTTDCVAMEVDSAKPATTTSAPPQPVSATDCTPQPISETQEAGSGGAHQETPAGDKSAELDEDVEYVVENIVDKKSDSNGLAKFLVKWENYPSDVNSWEPVENLGDCQKAMTKYELRRAERLAKIYGPQADRAPRGPGNGATGGAAGGAGPRERHKVYKVVEIMGLTLVNGEKYFLVSLADDMGSTFIRASLAHRLFPNKVIDFYMQHIKWKPTGAPSMAPPPPPSAARS